MMTSSDKAPNSPICNRQTLLCVILVCSAVYAYLYFAIAHKTFAVSSMIQSAMDEILSLQQQMDNLENSSRNVSKSKVKITQHLLVIFTTFPSNPEKYLCRNNTVKNWVSFGSNVKPVFFSDEPVLAEKVRAFGWDVLTPSKTAIGIPILKYMFLDVMKKYDANFYAYANGDLLFTQNLIDTLVTLLKSDLYSAAPMLIVGQRTNVQDVTREHAETYDSITYLSKIAGKLFTPWGEDYFITNAQYPWKDCPEIVVGRVAYDNWLVLNARKRNHTTIDATRTLLALHQTTKAGNSEGHRHKNGNFNSKLLGKTFGRINYAAGLTTCAAYLTNNDEENSNIRIDKRKLGRGCFPV